jgi:hypothetical protein
MAEKKVVKQNPAKDKTTKPKAVTAKQPAPKAKAKVAKKPVPKAVKKIAAVPAPKPIKVRKTRKAKNAISSYENLLKKESELEAAKKLAKNELRKEYDDFLNHADSIKDKYKKLFGESIESAPRKARKVGGRKSTGKPSRGYTLDQIESYINQKDSGGKIKIEGKNATGVARIKAAYDKSPNKDAKSILEFINK